MVDTGVIPTEEQMASFLLQTLQHSCMDEYFLLHLNLGKNDPERPHDLAGEWNKFQWEVISGLALDDKPGTPNYINYILPARELHRRQHHHAIYNLPDPNDRTKPNPLATIEDMLSSSIDAVCSRLQYRGYQGGLSSYDALLDGRVGISAHKKPYILQIIPEMRKIEQPKTGLITNLENFPNIGLESAMYEAIKQRVDVTLAMLREEHGYRL